ncbi:B12-binding domain-containing radical SAM protein [Clostridium beijerinckii]|uniref:B12-binding domain-containing radical SAM protein n=1 Tax=Clostridium beijerinckii TaxID=1520 RepID=UPI00098CA1A1|nr:radical SAM protein [Clostridium beijerinckii]MBA8932419.1 radical SAM superfamily enzyme YgiQ (UPF0313 family) [Clostridium beijerinckii]NRT37611.1 radical SAM superfamily enzyme YgiQ (UPF0313 family) [Clostridium beijerinckii]NRT48646.1 radical SAM superfamily enzyme YgiQ (UPF0313 family) [Clostridium beijerinckii]NRU36623.1 radical SAM superfamily enzyme YgiQ (UPF0313 family) [Clostridium beijerinckii]NRZ23058.1 radical SAM superfamily enzyme YgiQ (UPF0313 family) [Clostridium beijerinck
MDVVFVSNVNLSSEETGIPMGVLSLATILELHDYAVKVIDFNDDRYKDEFNECEKPIDKIDKIADILIGANPKIISFYTMCDTYHLVLYLAKKIKSMNEKIKIILGGPQATLTAKETLEKFKFIDIIGLGEGETYIEKLVSTILKKESLINVEGIALNGHDGSIIINPNNDLCNLDELPYLNYKLVNIDSFTTISLDAGRGCPFSCKFCASKTFWNQKYRMKSSRRLIEEIKLIKARFGVTRFRFVHDLFTLDKKFVLEFCHMLNVHKLRIEWSCSARLDTLNKEIVDAMFESGCNNIFMGIETGSARMQKQINKNLKLSGLLDMVDYIQQKNIKLTISFIYGFPNETMEDIKETLEMIVALYMKNTYMVQLNVWTPLPQTEFTNRFIDELEINLSSSGMTGDNPLFLENEWISNLVRENKSIFTQYYQLKNPTILKTMHLDMFMNDFFRFFYNTLPRTYQIILEYYENNVLEWFLDFKSINPEFYNLCNYYKSSDWEISLKKVYMIRKYIINTSELSNYGNITNILEEESSIYKIGFLKSVLNKR